MESLRSEPSPNLTQFEHRMSCSCCCCGDVVSNKTFVNTGSNQLDQLLEQHGVIGCDGLVAGLVDLNTTEVMFPGPHYKSHYKQNVQQVTHATLRDGRDVVIFKTEDAHQLGVGSMILSRQSPFTVDLYVEARCRLSVMSLTALAQDCVLCRRHGQKPDHGGRADADQGRQAPVRDFNPVRLYQGHRPICTRCHLDSRRSKGAQLTRCAVHVQGAGVTPTAYSPRCRGTWQGGCLRTMGSGSIWCRRTGV
jgi:hypothetical protein